jgi:spermidine/putrescine transport system substrate-binding protein
VRPRCSQACGAKSPEGTPPPKAAGTGTGTGSASAEPSIKAGTDVSDTEKVVNWANWTLYLDKAEKGNKYPTLEKFQKSTGIKASYAEDIDDNDSYYGKIQGQLKRGQDIGKDVITLTDWMAGRLIKNGYVQKLDKANIPNSKNILDNLADVDFDPGRNYSLTWQSGFTGLAYRKDKVGGDLKTLQDLWDPKLKGKVVVLSEMRDTIGLILLSQGKDLKTFTEDDFMAAVEELQKHVDSGQIAQVKGNSYMEDLRSGNAVAADRLVRRRHHGSVRGGDENYTFQLPSRAGRSGRTTSWCPSAQPTRRTPRSSWTGTTTRRSPPRSPRTSTTSARSRGRRRR